jgi:hypothetical protein
MSSIQLVIKKSALVFLLWAAVQGPLFGQRDPDVLGFDTGVYRYHFERADRELSPERWMQEAREGISLARRAWERLAGDLYQDPELLAEAGRRLDRWTEETLEERYTAWLLKRFFGTGIEALTEDLAGTVRELNRQYVYHTDGEGNILYDEATGDPVIIRPGEGDYGADLAAWRAKTRETLDTGMSRYEANLAGLWPELLYYIAEDRRDEFEGRLADLGASVLSDRRKEMEGILAREERLFTVRRTQDIWSQRRKSEAEAAGEITARLMTEIQGKCAEGIADLEARIEAADGESGDLVLAGEGWLEAYREQFERGLAAWEAAEEQFFVRRIEWERESGEHFLAGEEAWNGAYAELEQGRRNWEAQAMSLFEAGEARFKLASEQLEKAIAEAKVEFDLDARQRSEAGAERARAWVDMYVTCGTAMAEIREHVYFWLGYYNGEPPELGAGTLGAWALEQLGADWIDVKEQYERRDDYQQDLAYLQTLRTQAGWTYEDVLKQYGVKGAAIDRINERIKECEEGGYSAADLYKERDQLLTEYQVLTQWVLWYDLYHAEIVRLLQEHETVFQERHKLWYTLNDIVTRGYTGDYGTLADTLLAAGIRVNRERLVGAGELQRWDTLYRDYLAKAKEAQKVLTDEFAVVMNGGLLRDVLGAGAESEFFHLDEYQIELIRAQAVAGYWEKRLAIAEAVSLYGADLSAGRITDAESVEAWRRAKAGYDTALAAYGAAAGQLEAAGKALAEVRGALAAAKEAMGKAEAELEQLNKEYALLMAAYKLEDRDFILREIAAKYRALVEDRDRLEGGEPYYEAYLKQARTFGEERGLEQGGALLQALVTGTDGRSLAELSRAAEAVIRVDGVVPEEIGDYYIEETNPYYRVTAGLLAEWHEIAGTLDPASADPIRDRYGTLIRAAAAAAKGYAEAQVEERKDLIALLAAGSLAEWYRDRSGGAAAEFTAADAGLWLKRDAAAAKLAYLTARVKLERDVLGSLLGYGGSPAAQLLGALCYMEIEEAQAIWPVLDALAEALEALEGEDEETCRSELAAWWKTGEAAGYIIAGGSFCVSPGSIPLGDLFLRDEKEAYERKASLAAAYERGAAVAPALTKERAAAALAGIKRVFADYGITLTGGRLPETHLIGAGLEKRGTDLGTETVNFLCKLDEAAALFPGWTGGEYESWKQAFTAYMAAKAVYINRGSGIGGDPEAALIRAQEDQRKIESLYGTLGILEGDASKMAAINALLGELRARYGNGVKPGGAYLEAGLEELDRWYALVCGAQGRFGHEAAYRNAYAAILEDAKQAEIAGTRHWRTYITGSFLKAYNDLAETAAQDRLSGAAAGTPEGDPGTLRGAADWREGTLADAYEKAEWELRKLDGAWGLSFEADTAAALRAFAGEYLADTLKEWDPERRPNLDYVVYERYISEANKLRNRMNSGGYYAEEIGRLGNGYENLSGDKTAQEAELKKLAAKVEARQGAYKAAAAAYKAQADAFAAAGTAYEKRYGETKRTFTELEAARLRYEKEDAIRRWAGTAYLGLDDGGVDAYKPPEEERIYARERLLRAEAALNALRDLYSAGTAQRAYNDPAYNKLYQDYRESYRRMLLTLEARDAISVALEQEKANNVRLYGEFVQAGGKFAPSSLAEYYRNYQTPGSFGDYQWQDFLALDSKGRAKIAYTPGSFLLRAVTADEAAALAAYFSPGDFTGDGKNQASRFEQDLAAWSARMAAYDFKNPLVYQQWALAMDFILRGITQVNPLYSGIQSAYSVSGLGYSDIGGMAINGQTVQGLLIGYDMTMLLGMQQSAWLSLSAQQQEDLEMFLLCMVTGAAEGSKGFALISELFELSYLEFCRQLRYNYVSDQLKGVGAAWRGYWDEKHELEYIGYGIAVSTLGIQSRMINQGDLYQNGLETLNERYAAYLESNKTISALRGVKEAGMTVSWEDVKRSLEMTGSFDAETLAELAGYWEEMRQYDRGKTYTQVIDGLEALMLWGNGTRENIREAFDEAWRQDEAERAAAQQRYREAQAGYIEGTVSAAVLRAAAEAAYGSGTAARRNHLANLGNTMAADLWGSVTENGRYSQEYRRLAEEYVDLINRAYLARYDGELQAREAVWEQERNDIKDKIASWREAAGLIFERGRKDWKLGQERIQDGYVRWRQDFEETYERVDAAWNAAYLAGLAEKEEWLIRAEEAANTAATGAILALVGADAESMSRTFDVFDPRSMPGYGGVEEAAAILKDILNSAGIRGMEEAFEAAGSSAGTIASQVRRGIGGVSVWNAAQAQAAAHAFARQTKEYLALGSARVLAAKARAAAEAAVRALAENVRDANAQFDESMDDTFILNGGWSRLGMVYVRDVIVNSTVWDQIITEKAYVEAYRNYIQPPWELKTDLSDKNLNVLDTYGIQALIGAAQREVEEKGKELFGDGGFFLLWIGDAPILKPNPNPDDGQWNIFIQYGSGELGRLLRDYYYWLLKGQNGVALMNAPLWEKPMWDSRGSWFDAPSVRSIVDTYLQVVSSVASTIIGAVGSVFTGGAAMAAMAGVNATFNLLDDAIFASLDVAGGYKTKEVAGLEFGKKAAIGFGTSLVTMGFSAIGSAIGTGASLVSGVTTQAVAGSVSKVLAQTALAGVQALTNATVTSAVNAITWNEEDGLSWSRSAFRTGMRNGAVGALTAMTSSFTSGLMNYGMEGFYGQVYNTGKTLNNLAGGIAGQAVNYASGGNFDFNILNLGMLGIKSNDRALISSGLVELHLGRDGVSMNVGTGGTDISLGTVVNAMRGLEAWKVNAELFFSRETETRDYLSAMRTLYSGTSENRAEYEAILAGQTDIVESRGFAETASIYNAGTGIKTILLGDDALNDGSRFGLNVILSHESYRDGIYNGLENQGLETDRAVAGHINTALGLMETYGKEALGVATAAEALVYQYAQNTGNTDLQRAILNGYDAGADYWKVLKDGNILFDGSKNLYDEDGNLLKEYTGDGGYTKSLAAVLGISESEADKMLRDAGLTYEDGTFKRQGIDAKNNADIVIQTSPAVKNQLRPQTMEDQRISMGTRQADGENEKTPGAFARWLSEKGAQTSTWATDTWNDVTDSVGGIWTIVTEFIGHWFGRTNEAPTDNTASPTDNTAYTSTIPGVVETQNLQNIERILQPLDQKKIGDMVNLPGNKTCLVTTWLMVYLQTGEVSLDALVAITREKIKVEAITSEAVVDRQLEYSQALAQEALGEMYDGKYLQYPWKDGKQVLYETKEDFYDSAYEHGIIMYKNLNDKTKKHFTYINNNTKTELDPWPNGIGSIWEKYQIKEIRPLGWYR